MTTRTTIYLDETLLERVRRFVAPRGLSSLIGELLGEKVRQLEQAEIEAAMREGYLATRNERQALNADWQVGTRKGSIRSRSFCQPVKPDSARHPRCCSTRFGR